MKARFLALAALVLGLASCQTDPSDLNVDWGGEQDAVVTVALPADATRAAGADSALGAIDNGIDMNAYDIRFMLEVYDANGDLAKDRMTVTGDETSASFSLRLVPGREYKFVAWADFVINGTEDNLHYNTNNLANIQLIGTQNLNDESRDAYTAYEVINYSNTANISLTLTRPFAKLRVVTTDMKELYSGLTEAKVNYTSKLYTSFNALTATPGDLTAVGEKTIAYSADNAYSNEQPDADGKMTLFADYFFGSENDAVKFTLDLKDGTTETIPQIVFNTNIPVQRNYLTTVMGPILTDANSVTVTIDDDFKTPGFDFLTVDTAESLRDAIAMAEDGATIILENGVYNGLFYIENKSLTLKAAEADKAIINGKLAIAAAGKTINVDGIKFENSYTGSVATGHQYLDKTGKYCIGLYCASVNVNNCTFELSDNGGINFYAFNAPDRCTVTNSVFNCNGFRPILSKANLTVSGCTFNDQYKYSLQVWGNQNNGEESVVFEKNTINEAGKTSGCENYYKSYVSVSKSYPISNVAFIIQNNTAGHNFVYDNHDNVKITTCTLNGKDIVASQCVAVADDIKEVVMTYEEGVTYVATAQGLKDAIAAANNNTFSKIRLLPGTYTGAFDIDAKSVELYADYGDKVVIDGLVHGLNFAHITLKNITLTNATPAKSTSARHTADYYCLGAYVADIVIENCVFDINNEGNAAGKGGINIYANRDDYELYDGFDLTIKNTTFNCNGERPIRAKTNSCIEGCTFNDQHRYAIQVQGNSGLATETVKFVNNTIVDPCKTSNEAFFAGVSISKSQLLENAAFIISGNTEGAKFVYDNHDNVKITTCTLNGVQITNEQCVTVASDAKEVVINATPGMTYVATAQDLKVALKNNNATEIQLLPGNYEGTFHVLRDVKIVGADNAKIIGRVHINSANATFENVMFDRNETNSNEPNNTASNALQYKAVVMIYGDQTHTIKFDCCKFYNNNGTHKSAITNVACDLIVDNCYFEGYSSSIYSQANLSVTNSTFNYTGGNNVILSINGCGDNGGKVIFKNNTITNHIFALSQFLNTVGFGNGTYHFDIQGNTEGAFDYYFLNENRVTNKTFADGSRTF